MKRRYYTKNKKLVRGIGKELKIRHYYTKQYTETRKGEVQTMQ